jgi:predicted esterase
VSLDNIRNEVFELYQSHEYEEALEVARAALDEFPASASYWVACLLAVTGQSEAALDALEEGLTNGGWWPPLVLVMDPDLEPIRGSNRFANLVDRSERAWKQAFKAAPEVDIYPPTIQPSGALLVALHGMGGEAASTFARYWTSACDHGAVVVVPQSSQPHTPEGGRCWLDEERTDRDLQFVYDRVTSAHGIDPVKVILCGFSQGARVAIRRSLAAKPFKTCGFIAVAPGVIAHQLDVALPSADPNVRGVFVVGTDDVVLEPVRALHSKGTEQGFEWQLHEVPDLAHDFPNDFSTHLRDALRFLLPGS